MKTRFTKKSILLFITCLLNHLSSAQSWQALGPDITGQILAGPSTYTSLALDATGMPLVAFIDLVNGDKAMVKKYNGTNWETLGNTYFSAGAAAHTRLALDARGTPVVAYQDKVDNSKAKVKKYDGTNWVDVGTTGISIGIASYISLALNANGMPLVAYQDGVNGNKAAVKKFDGSNWVNVGAAGFSAGIATYTSLALDTDGTPFVAFMDGANGNKATVKKYTGNSWVNVGVAGFSAGPAYHTRLALDANGAAFIAYQDGAQDYKVTVKKFNGSSWIDVGASGPSVGTGGPSVGTGGLFVGAGSPSDGRGEYPDLALDASGIPFVVYGDRGANRGKATVKKYNGSSWVDVGPAGFSAGEAYSNSIAIDANGLPTVAFEHFANGFMGRATVLKYTTYSPPIIITQPVAVIINVAESASFTVAASQAGSLTYQWQVSTDGGSTFFNINNGDIYSGATTSTLNITSALSSMNGNQYRVIVSNGAIATSTVVTLTVVAPHNISNWQVVGPPGFSAGEAWFTSLALERNGTPFIAYRDEANGGKATVKKLDGNNWVDVGMVGFSAGGAKSTNLVFNASGIPFIAYRDEVNGGRATVKKFNGNNWVDVGSAGFSAGGADFTNLAFDAAGVPFIAYEDLAHGGKATVKKFDGNNWVDVGMAGFSADMALFTELELDRDGTPYVSFTDWSHDGRVTVMKYTEGSWITVGSAGFSAGGAYPNFVLDGKGTPFVAYQDWVNGNRMTVMKYDGNNWINVGPTGFSMGTADYTSLAVDASGTPFVAFRHWVQGYRATVMKYNGSNWETVGTAGFSAGEVWFTSIMIDANGVPFVAYRDKAYNGKATVMKFASVIPTAPSVTGATNCGPGAVTLTAEGTENGNYRWYNTPTGGIAIPNAISATYITPSLTATTTYYVSVVNGTFESERTAVTATINSLPSAPVVEANLFFCQGATAKPLTAVGRDLKWYTTATGGTALAEAPIPGTTSAGTTTYYVSQTVNGCESQRAKSNVTITALPTVTLPAFTKNLCSTSTSFALTGGQPAGGTYSGVGVSNGVFNASTAGVGKHTITYTYIANGCTGMATQELAVSTCTGIDESELALGLSLYPNPTKDKLHLILPLPGSTTLQLKLWDAKGQLVLKQSYLRVTGEFNQILDLIDKAPGIYLLQLITDDEVITKRVVMQ